MILSKGIRIFVYFLFIPFSVYSQNTVLVIDTGYTKYVNKKMCKSGHKDFTKTSNNLDKLKHGTNVISIISKSTAKYCITSYKAFDTGPSSIEYTKAIVSASFKKFDVVNLSIQGRGFDLLEKKAIERMLKKGTYVVVAAGNQGENLDKSCTIYPACYIKYFKKYKRFRVIGAKDLWLSNKGKLITDWELGKQQGKPLLSGTSQAAANYTKKLVDSLFN